MLTIPDIIKNVTHGDRKYPHYYFLIDDKYNWQ